MDEAERIRREFAAGWAKIGAAWGVAPSTAAVQGYLLLHGGPLTEAELRDALGFSHRAALLALRECETWGLVEQVEPRRARQRGPAGRAWIPVQDHWEWFRRVAGARKERETDPVLPLLDSCLRQAQGIGDGALRERLSSLLAFTHQFDRGVAAVVAADPRAMAHLFGVLATLEARALERLLQVLADIPEPQLAKAAAILGGLPPAALRRLVALAGNPGMAKVISRLR